MININMGSITTKVEDYFKTAKGKKKIEKVKDDIMLGKLRFGYSTKSVKTPTQAAEKFIQILEDEVQSHFGSDYALGDLGQTAIESIKLEHDKPYKIGNRYYVNLKFVGDLHRKSLRPDYYDGVKNIVALLNKGYPRIHSVYGVWQGHGNEPRYSLTERDGAHFIEDAVRRFVTQYGKEYGILDIDVSNEYIT